MNKEKVLAQVEKCAWHAEGEEEELLVWKEGNGERSSFHRYGGVRSDERRRNGESNWDVGIKEKKEIGLVAGDELFDFGLIFDNIAREIYEGKEETIQLWQEGIA